MKRTKLSVRFFYAVAFQTGKLSCSSTLLYKTILFFSAMQLHCYSKRQFLYCKNILASREIYKTVLFQWQQQKKLTTVSLVIQYLQYTTSQEN